MHLVLIDALNLIRRIYAVCESQYGAGTNDAITHALERTLKASNKLLSLTSPEYAIAAFDGDTSWRQQFYSGYKANRKPMPALLKQHLADFSAQFHNAGISTLFAADFEADDILATFAHKGAQQHIKVTLVSTDKGYLPLTSQGVAIYDYFSREYRTMEHTQDKFGVPAHTLWQYFALVGDKTNDIPGVPGIGQKTAKALINEFGDVKSALSSSVYNKTQQRLADNLDDYVRALALVSLRTDIDLGVSLKQLRIGAAPQQIEVQSQQASRL